jgi:hypothetical protein
MNNVRAMNAEHVVLETEEVCKTPEARLMLAVLEEALATFRRGLTSIVPAERQSFREVESWLRCVDTDSPFAFESICWTLGMDPGYVRAGFYQVKCEASINRAASKVRKLRRERVYDRRVWKGHIGC